MTTQEWKFNSKEIANKPDLFLPGHRACAGCVPATVLKLVMKATRGPTIVTEATGCMEVVSSIYPYTAWPHHGYIQHLKQLPQMLQELKLP